MRRTSARLVYGTEHYILGIDSTRSHRHNLRANDRVSVFGTHGTQAQEQPSRAVSQRVPEHRRVSCLHQGFEFATPSGLAPTP